MGLAVCGKKWYNYHRRKEPDMRTENEILNDPAMSYWLKDAIKKSEQRDIVDALNDAEFLVGYLRQKLDIIQGSR